MIEQQLLRAILANQSIIFGQCGGARDGETFTIRTQTGSIPARAYGAIAPGQCVAYRVGGQWLAVSAGVAQRLNQYVLEFQRRRSDVLLTTRPIYQLFLISEANFDTNVSRQHYWLTDGTNILKVFTSEPYDRINGNSGDRIIMAFLHDPVSARVVNWWVLDTRTVILQFLTTDWSTYDGSASLTISKQVTTVLVEDWAVSLLDTQQSQAFLPPDPITYPPLLQPYSDWLVQQQRNFPQTGDFQSIPPIYDIVNAIYGGGEFELTGFDNADINQLPTQVLYKFRDGDLLGDPINGYPLEGGVKPGEKVRYNLVTFTELNTFPRAWTVATPNSTTDIVVPFMPYEKMSSDSTTFTDDLLLYTQEDTYTIGQIKDGTYNPVDEFGFSKLAGWFSDSEYFASTGIVNQLFILGVKTATIP